MKIKRNLLILSVLLSSIVMSGIDGIIKPNYLLKSLIKLFLFLVLPIFLIKKDQIIKLFKPTKGILSAFGIGLLVYGVVIGGYFILNNQIDFSAITENLTKDTGVTPKNFVFVSIYISFINSLLEEFFFRGFAFIVLSKLTSIKFSYIFSSIMFAVYHLGMTIGWFNIWLWILAIFGLFLGGCVFNFLDKKNESILPSWIVHIFANFAINTVGFVMFGMF